MNDEEIRHELAAVLRLWEGRPPFPPTIDALVPLVHLIANRRTASALRSTADGTLDWPRLVRADLVADSLRIRADMLDPS